MRGKSYIWGYDQYILGVFLLLLIFGLIVQLNISSVRSSMTFFYRQLLWVFLALAALWIGYKKVSLEELRKYVFPLIVFTVILLIMVLILGTKINGSLRSFRIWKFNFQPSILARVVLILYTAHLLDKQQHYVRDSRPGIILRHCNALLVIPGIILSLIVMERHFTPLIISSLTLLGLLFLARVRLFIVLPLAGIFLMTCVLVINLGSKFRSERIESYKRYSLFFPNSHDANTQNSHDDYQVRQSLISLANGSFFGTSPARGTGKHYFLPEAKTDYVFSIIGEEYGFFGALIIMTLFGFLFLRAVIVCSRQESLFIKLAGLGLAMNIYFNAMINIGVAMSALPSTGVTLPFISYGGTSLVVNSFTVGLLLNISGERKIL